MFKLQPDSKKELLRIGTGTLVLAAAMVAVFALLGLVSSALIGPCRWAPWPAAA